MMNSVMKIMDYLNVPLTFQEVSLDKVKNSQENGPLNNNECVLMGPVARENTSESESKITYDELKNKLEVYGSITNLVSMPGHEVNLKEFDMLMIQQCDKQITSEEAKVESASEIDQSQKRSETIARYAFNTATLTNRKRISTIVNEHEISNSQLLNFMKKEANLNKRVEHTQMDIEKCASMLQEDPFMFEMIVLQQNSGRKISEAVLNLVGGPGVTPSVLIGDKHSVFKQAGSFPSFEQQGKNTVNPTGLLLAASMMLRHVELPKYADLIEDAIWKTYSKTDARTQDFGGNYSTEEFTNVIVSNIGKKANHNQNTPSKGENLGKPSFA